MLFIAKAKADPNSMLFTVIHGNLRAAATAESPLRKVCGRKLFQGLALGEVPGLLLRNLIQVTITWIYRK